MRAAFKKRVCCAMAALALAIGLPAASGPLMALLVAEAHAQAASPGPVASTVAVGGIALRSDSIDLPTSGQMFPGDASAQAINNNCLGCHSAEMVLTQPALSPSTWREEVGKMRTVYKAPVPDEDVPAIVAYLSSLRAKE